MSGSRLFLGDCLDALRQLPDASVDSVVTDPPYGLSFMGKRWDYDVPSVEVWAECLRVLKPGGHLLAFAGTRTQHRMAVRIEDAGFEIRDMIAWVYSTGFPKSHNLDRERGKSICGCSGDALPYAHEKGLPGEPPPERDLRSLRNADVSQAVDIGEGRGEVLQPGLPQPSTPATRRAELPSGQIWPEKPGMERRGNFETAEGELRYRSLPPSAGMGDGDGQIGRLRNGAPSGDGRVVPVSAEPHGVRSSHRPQPLEQRPEQSGIVAGQQEPQTGGAWPLCGGCGLPMVPSGFGTALKPSLEPLTVARKPLSEGTVAANVLEHGTGALNIDGCRVGMSSEDAAAINAKHAGMNAATYQRPAGVSLNLSQNPMALKPANAHEAGRWPANLIHDGSEEVTGLLGDAARFFYTPKTGGTDRNEGTDDRNHHPTVKPTDLMQYLCRLVTPPGGTVLDPFMGSGSTGKAAQMEGFRFIGCERDPDYFAIAKARIETAHGSLFANIADIEVNAA